MENLINYSITKESQIKNLGNSTIIIPTKLFLIRACITVEPVLS